MNSIVYPDVPQSRSFAAEGPFRLVAACLVALFLMTLLAGLALAAPGGNSAAAAMCKDGGFTDWIRDEEARTGFTSTGECVRYAAQGGQLLERGTVVDEGPGEVVVEDPGVIILPPADPREVSLTWAVAYGHPADFETYGYFCFGIIHVSGFQPGTYEVSISNSNRDRTYQLVVDETGTGSATTKQPGLGDDSWIAASGPKTATVDGVTSPESTPSCG
jgi:hypothetical protein